MKMHIRKKTFLQKIFAEKKNKAKNPMQQNKKRNLSRQASQ
jgi:hypothetical protein